MNAALAGDAFPELRLATTAGGKFEADIVTAAWFVDAPAWTRAIEIELAAGLIDGTGSTQTFAFAGPVWRLSREHRSPYVEFSFGPALLSDSRIGDRELGGNVHFRSALALGRSFGRRRSLRIALRVAHYSNGGLRDHNPGLDTIGISFVSGDAD